MRSRSVRSRLCTAPMVRRYALTCEPVKGHLRFALNHDIATAHLDARTSAKRQTDFLRNRVAIAEHFWRVTFIDRNVVCESLDYRSLTYCRVAGSGAVATGTLVMVCPEASRFCRHY